MKKRNLRSLNLNKKLISNFNPTLLKGGSWPSACIQCPTWGEKRTECASEETLNTLALGCVPHGPSVDGDC